MAESMSHVERVLWRIAELGARCSQQAAAGERGPLWAELETTIAGLETEFEAACQAVDIAPAQVRSLEGRLKAVEEERDRAKAAIQEHKADADAARRERDRAIQKARKAMAITVEAKNAALEARSTAAESVARASAAENSVQRAQAARKEAIASRDEAVNTLAMALADRDKAVNALADALAAGERAADVRDEAIASRDTTLRALESAHARITELEAALEAARTKQDDAVDTLAARAEGAVVVLPGVEIPEAPVGPITSGNRIAWQPTWSEWSRPDDADDEAAHDMAADVADVADMTDVTDVTDIAETPTEIRLDENAPEEEGDVRYLNVAATIAQLLPQDLGPLLLSGATVVRREGRLFATLAVPTRNSADTEQVDRFTNAGFKVEWTANAPLGV